MPTAVIEKVEKLASKDGIEFVKFTNDKGEALPQVEEDKDECNSDCKDEEVDDVNDLDDVESCNQTMTMKMMDRKTTMSQQQKIQMSQ